MEFGKALERYQSDFFRFLIGALLLLYLTIKKFYLINFEVIIQLSTVERVLIFLILSIAIGKLSWALGNFIINIFVFTFLEEDRKKFLDEVTKKFKHYLRFGPKKSEQSNRLLYSELINFIESKEALKRRYHDIKNESAFWHTFLGANIICLALYKVKEYPVILILFAFSFVMSLYISYVDGKFWANCSLLLRREREQG